MNDIDIVNYFWGNHKQLSSKKLENIPQDILNYLNSRYNDSLSLLETINRIKLHIEIHPICPICQTNLVQYKGRYLSKDIFQSTCQNKNCRNQFNVLKGKQTKLDRYGDENYCNVLKIKQTKLERYGDAGYHNFDKAKQTCLKKYGNENFGGSENAKLKSKQTKLERYCDENYCNVLKIKQTKLERYGNENYSNRELAVKHTDYKKQQDKIKQTCLERYGITNGGGSEESLKKIRQTCLNKYGVEYYTQSNEFKEKAKETWLNKYGVEHPMQSQIIKSKIDYESLVNKMYETKKKNNSYNKSEPEDNIYEILLTKFNDVKRQYKSNKYPFRCDFYIPSLDLYIEYNEFWTHGPKPFENTYEDNILLNNWKEKSLTKSFYNVAIEVWTIYDVKKRTIAKDNNINYIEFFTIEDFYKWFNNLD